MVQVLHVSFFIKDEQTGGKRMEFICNRLNEKDINALRASVGWRVFDSRQMQTAMQNTRYSVMCYDEHQPVAMGRIIGDGIYYMLVDVITRPDYQQKGIATQVINQLIKMVRDAIPTGGRCSIALVAATGKEPFYERFHFVPLPDTDSGHGMQMRIRK